MGLKPTSFVHMSQLEDTFQIWIPVRCKMKWSQLTVPDWAPCVDYLDLLSGFHRTQVWSHGSINVSKSNLEAEPLHHIQRAILLGELPTVWSAASSLNPKHMSSRQRQELCGSKLQLAGSVCLLWSLLNVWGGKGHPRYEPWKQTKPRDKPWFCSDIHWMGPDKSH